MARTGRGFPSHLIIAAVQKAASVTPPAVTVVPERTLMGVGV